MNAENTRVFLIGKSVIASEIQGPIYPHSVQELDMLCLCRSHRQIAFDSAIRARCNHFHNDDVCGCSTLLDRLGWAGQKGRGSSVRHGLATQVRPLIGRSESPVAPRPNSGSVMASLAAGSLAFLAVFGLLRSFCFPRSCIIDFCRCCSATRKEQRGQPSGSERC